MNKTREELERIDAETFRRRDPYYSSGLTPSEWRQVFADAKSVKDTALQNARIAMEEAFASCK